MSLNRVVILDGLRIPFCRTGTNYKDATTQDLLIACVSKLVQKTNLEGQVLGDVALGAVMHHSADWNFAREVVLGSGLSLQTPAFTILRACGTGLDAFNLIASKIMSGQIDVGMAGGADSMSDLPLGLSRRLTKRLLSNKKAKNLKDYYKIWRGTKAHEFKPIVPAVTEPRTGKTMGEHCELMAQDWLVSREEQDTLAYKSHANAVAAHERGFFKDLVMPHLGAEYDNNVRSTTSIKKLNQLRSIFDPGEAGTLTAGNSSALTDGASAVLLSSEQWAKDNGYPIKAYLKDYQNAAVDIFNEGLLMGPVYTVAKLLKRNNLTLQDFDFYEIHEAFAAQVLCNLKAWESEKFCKDKLGLSKAIGAIDRNKMNVAGGSIAIGHPFAATGGRIISTLSELLVQKGSGTGLISICTDGGMGTAAILERV